MNINEQISRIRGIMGLSESAVYVDVKSESVIDEGWKQWLVGGLLSLATLGGVKYYFLNPNSDANVKKEYVNTLQPKIDSMDMNSLLELAKQVVGDVMPDTTVDWNDKSVQHHYMAVIADRLKAHPESFALGENGKIIYKPSAFNDFKAVRTNNLMRSKINL